MFNMSLPVSKSVEIVRNFKTRNIVQAIILYGKQSISPRKHRDDTWYSFVLNCRGVRISRGG